MVAAQGPIDRTLVIAVRSSVMRSRAVLLLATAMLVAACTSEAPAARVSPEPSSSLAVAADVPVTATDLIESPAHNSPRLAVDPTDSDFVIVASRQDAPDFGCHLNVSGDGGRSWIPVQPVPQLPDGAEKCYAPKVAFGRDGRLYYLFVGLHTSGNTPMGVFLTTSSDRARSFSAPRLVVGAHAFSTHMVMDRSAGKEGRVHLVWIQANAAPAGPGFPPGPNPIVASYSDDGGETFTSPTMVSDAGRQRVTAPAVALGPDRSLHVLYYDLNDDARDYQGLEGPAWEGEWSLLVASSLDGGQSFGPSQLVEPAVVPPERVMLVLTMPPASLGVDEQGRIVVAWHDARNGDWDVFVRRSDPAGEGWSEPQRVNDDEIGNGRHQYLPQLDVAPGGRIDLVYYDRRRDPDNLMNDVSFTWSTDGGATFAPTLRPNRESFDSRGGARYPHAAAEGLVESGSGLGLASDGGRAIAAWPDARNSYGGVTEKVARPDQDIFATEVSFTGDAAVPGEAGDP